MIRLSAIFCLLLSLSGLPARAEITVFAAASLRDAVTEISRLADQPTRLSFGGSGSMARQIAGGAPADVVILAHPNWISWLAEKDLLHAPPVNVAGNRLVLVAARDTLAPFVPDADGLLTALGGGRLAVGQRAAVPAGIYAREWLQSIGAWDRLVPYLAETDNVRAALALVAVRAAPMGIVYASDAMADPRITILHEIPEKDHAPIVYPAAALTADGEPFLSLLQGAEARAIFAAHGFAPVQP